MGKTIVNKCILACLLLVSCNLFGQKPALDLAYMDKWAQVQGGAISNDGKYVSYTVNNQPAGNSSFTVQASAGGWKKVFQGINGANFTGDSRKLVFMKGQDTLCLLGLGTNAVENILDVAYYRLFKQGKTELLAIQKTEAAKNELVIRNLATGKEQSYANVGLYTLSEDGNIMIVQRSVKDGEGNPVQAIDWADLLTGKTIPIWQGKGNPGNFVFDGSRQLAFTIEELIDRKPEKSIWLYQANAASAVPLKYGAADGDVNLNVDMLTAFSIDGTRLFLKLKKPAGLKAKPGAVKVDIWSYTDAKLQAQQLKDLENPSIFVGAGVARQNYAAIIDLKSHKQVQLEQEDEYAESLFNSNNDDWMVIRRSGGAADEEYWSKAAQASFFLVSTRDGQRKLLNDWISSLSPNGQFALGLDCESDIYCYDMVSGAIRDLTKQLPVPAGDGHGTTNDDMPKGVKSHGFQVAGWLSDNRSVIVYDRYDIWQLDASGLKSPVNLTSGYGRKHKIVFRLLTDISSQKEIKSQELILTAFNVVTKENGFYKISFNNRRDPEKLTMGPFVYYVPGPGMGSKLIKARDADLYLVHRESASESPNYFLTKDFKSFKQVSSVYPEKEYNWMRSELVNFRTLDGKEEQGALYRPENFDPKKKYPVIIHYYERKTDLLNSYHQPEPAYSEINIPWFVSRGYLVFTPDIHYTIGEPGESALNSVVGAANHLKTFSFVNAEKMGIQGHSFGGFETNYIVTHTSIFAAALESAGPSNLIGFYNDLWGGGFSKQESMERDQLRIGATLWERPDLYIKNSPILRADKITTPLLMVQNKEDGANPFHHGVELFTALRRLGKRAWMLQYDGQGHNVTNKNSRIDYTIRMTQFFDHYLKGAAAPQWMMRGIPAKLKGVDDGLALDTTGATPGPGLLIHEKKASD